MLKFGRTVTISLSYDAFNACLIGTDLPCRTSWSLELILNRSLLWGTVDLLAAIT